MRTLFYFLSILVFLFLAFVVVMNLVNDNAERSGGILVIAAIVGALAYRLRPEAEK